MTESRPRSTARSWPWCDLGIAARGPGGRPGVEPVHSAELCSKDSPPTFPLVSRTARDLLLQLGGDW